ncbi:1-phosphofructokinase [Alkalithermobacter paradoxus]|uniref:Tagatose-6-phosphate kinase n=1 Tax=Alkalithermobacter paradoxus TaxID=29349 RepID=A0A1V4IB98_9FIRM|nr:tagatose-6-phosphate kinase [[Clostridium] thermoalcaliphilum]
MIYTVTLNPAIDKTIFLDSMRKGEVNRIKKVIKDVGGKGINVSKVLKVLGKESIVLGFLGSDNKKYFVDFLEDANINHDFITVDGENRTNLKIIELDSDIHTDINDIGFSVDEESVNLLLNRISSLDEDDVVVLSGSIPSGVSDDIYRKIIETIKHKNAKVILDADGKALIEGIKAKPYMIKPNVHELKNIVDFDENNMDSIVEAGKKLVNQGIEKVLISMGELGSLYITKKDVLYANPLKLEVKSTVGAGDSMVAAIAYGIEDDLFDLEILKLASACGACAVMTEGSKMLNKDIIETIKQQININRR